MSPSFNGDDSLLVVAKCPSNDGKDFSVVVAICLPFMERILALLPKLANLRFLGFCFSFWETPLRLP